MTRLLGASHYLTIAKMRVLQSLHHAENSSSIQITRLLLDILQLTY